MNTRGIVYGIRRKIQVLAYSMTSPKFMSKVYFRIVLHQKLDLKNPKTFNEKIQWYKLNYCVRSKKVVECSDKYRIRKYLKEKELLKYAIPMIGYWDNVDDIPWNDLPDRFVIKCNHGCAYNIICKDKSELDIDETKKTLKKWLREDFGKFNAEPHYSRIKRGIICEEYLGDGKSEFLTDYKVHCFNGIPKFVLICSGRSQKSVNYNYYDFSWNKLPYSTTQSADFAKPESLEEMINISTIIAKDFPFVRVDFYEIEGQPIIGELTFVPAGGLDDTIPKQADYEIGEMLNLQAR